MKTVDTTDRFNICVITHPIIGPNGATVLANLVDVLAPLSNELFVITGEFPDRPNEKILIISIKNASEKQSILPRAVNYLAAQLQITYNLIRISKDIDIVIFFIGSGTYVLPVLAAKLFRKKIVIVATGLASKSAEKTAKGDDKRLSITGKIMLAFVFRSLENANFHLADQIAVQTESAIDFLGLNNYREKISIHGAMYIDRASFKIKKDLAARRNLIGYIGRFSPEKGIANFVKAVPLILEARPDLEFLIAGQGQLSDELKRELIKSKAYDKVKLKGWIPRDELPGYLNELKLLVLPSYSEGLPGIVQEGMACGTPILATAVGGLPDLIKDGKTGFILESNAPECIAQNAIRALNYPQLGEVTQNARCLVEQHYTFEAAVAGYRNILASLKPG